MPQVCAYQFVLRPRDGESSQHCLDGVRDEITDWIGDIYRANNMEGVAIPFDGTCLAPHPTHELWSDQRECATHRLATLEWVWPEGVDPTLSWMLDFAVACDDKAVQVSLRVQLVSRPFRLRPLRIAMTAQNPLSFLPSLVARVLRLWPGEIDGWPIPTRIRMLRANAIDRFVRETLHSTTRVLPVVVINLAGPVTVKEGGLQNAQDRLLGLAQVAVLANASAGRRLEQVKSDEAPWTEDCPARIYWPRLPDDRYDIPIQSLVAEIQEAMKRMSLDQFLLTKFIDYSAARYREGELIRTARVAVDRERAGWRRLANTFEREAESATAEARQAQEERDRLRQECDTARQVIRSLQGDLTTLRDAVKEPNAPSSFDELAVELERAWDDNRRLTADIETERQQLAQLRDELRIHQENWTLFAASRRTEGRAPAPVPLDERTFASAGEALRSAAEDFADVLVVWEGARRSAEQSPFRTPSKIYRALQAIAEVGRDYFQARDGGAPLGPVEQAFACRVPFKYTGFESQTTLHLYGAERVFHHADVNRQMQRHLTLGGGDTNNCLQIYFDFDDASRRVLIGYCGRHLPYHRQRT